MKSIKKIPVFIVAFFLATLGACETGLYDNDSRSLSDEHIAFENALNQVLVRAGEKLNVSGGNRFALGELFRSSYAEVFEDEAGLESYDFALANMMELRKRKEAPGFTELLVTTSDTPEIALERIADALGDGDLEESVIIELLVVRQTIQFMMEHHEQLAPAMPVFTMSILDGEHNDEGDRGEPKEEMDDGDPDSWWSSWGSCAAGTIGTAGEHTIAGCGVGFLVGGVKGCVIGGTIGVISGSLKGASEYC